MKRDKKQSARVQKNIGLVGIVIVFFVDAILCMASEQEFLAESIVMTAGLAVILALSLLRYRNATVLFSIGLMFGYIIRRLLIMTVYTEGPALSFFLWALLPSVLCACVLTYWSGSELLDLELEIRIEQHEELVLISPSTGLYNLKCLHCDLRMEQAYCERNKRILSLMAIQIVLPEETDKSWGEKILADVYRAIGIMIIDLVRVEDRVYSMNEEGLYGVLMICSKEQSEVVVDRMKRTLCNKENYSRLLEDQVDVEVKIACLEFDKKEYGDDVVLFEHAIRGMLP